MTDKVATLHTPSGQYVGLREFERVCAERDAALENAETQRAAAVGYRQERDEACRSYQVMAEWRDDMDSLYRAERQENIEVRDRTQTLKAALAQIADLGDVRADEAAGIARRALEVSE